MGGSPTWLMAVHNCSMNMCRAATFCLWNSNVGFSRTRVKTPKFPLILGIIFNLTTSYRTIECSHLEVCKWEALKKALWEVISCQAGGDRRWNVTPVQKVFLKSQLHSNASPSAVKLPSAEETTVIFALHAVSYCKVSKDKHKHHSVWRVGGYFSILQPSNELCLFHTAATAWKLILWLINNHRFCKSKCLPSISTYFKQKHCNLQM